MKCHGRWNRTLDEEIEGIESLLKVLDVELETGICRWKITLGSRALAGSLAGSTSSYGYTAIGHKNKSYYVHRIVFYVANGYLPPVVDHKNGVEMGNGKDNLQEVTQQQNTMKAKRPKNNKSGHKGVNFDKTRNKWVARIKFNRIGIFLGRFDTLEEAILVYETKAKELFGEFYNEDYS